MCECGEYDLKYSVMKPKRRKGCIIYKCPTDFTLLDLETTGFDPNKDKIIEISALKVRNSKIVDTFSTLTNPGFPIPAHITKLTGITTEDVIEKPSSIDVINEFISFIGDDIIIGHNIGFDVNFIYEAYLTASGKYFKNNYVDTLYLSRIVLKDLNCHKLAALCKHFSIPQESAHRALDDCYNTFEIYNRLVPLFLNLHAEDQYYAQHKKETPSTVDTSSINPNNPFYEKVCVFTGELTYYNRSSAEAAVKRLGAICGNSVTKKTDYLIVGNTSYNPSIKEGLTTKQRKAEELILKGQDISIISEDVFYDMLNGN